MYRNPIPTTWKDNLPGWTIFQLTDSNARDYLASERTYLSWIRTGIASVALGAGIAKFFDKKEQIYQVLVSIISIVLISFGLLSTFYAYIRHSVIVKELLDQKISIDSFGPLVMATVGILVSILVLVLLFI